MSIDQQSSSNNQWITLHLYKPLRLQSQCEAENQYFSPLTISDFLLIRPYMLI